MNERRQTSIAVARAAIVALAVTIGTGDRLAVAVGAVSCTQYSDCAPFVCVSNECVPCWNDDSQCDLTSQNYCDLGSGDCTSGAECLPLGFPYGTGFCDFCDAMGNGMCYAPHWSCGLDGYCHEPT